MTCTCGEGESAAGPFHKNGCPLADSLETKAEMRDWIEDSNDVWDFENFVAPPPKSVTNIKAKLKKDEDMNSEQAPERIKVAILGDDLYGSVSDEVAATLDCPIVEYLRADLAAKPRVVESVVRPVPDLTPDQGEPVFKQSFPAETLSADQIEAIREARDYLLDVEQDLALGDSSPVLRGHVEALTAIIVGKAEGEKP